MRFITFDKNGVETVGMRLGAEVVDLSVVAPQLPKTLLGLIQANRLTEAGQAAQKAGAKARLPLEGIKYLPVMPRPPKFFGLGLNYPSHVKTRPETPGFFISTPSRFIAHNDPMWIPRASKTLDHEVELAFVFNKLAHHVKEKDALGYVAGYAVFNDGSVRRLGGGNPLALAVTKNSDRTGPMGPEFVTPDELPPGCDGLTIQLRRSGKVVQHDKTSNMFWKIPEAIELITSMQSFGVGDMVTTGTCGGTIADAYGGKGVDPESLPYLTAGEVIESEIEGVGMLRNPIIDEPMPS